MPPKRFSLLFSRGKGVANHAGSLSFTKAKQLVLATLSSIGAVAGYGTTLLSMRQANAGVVQQRFQKMLTNMPT